MWIPRKLFKKTDGLCYYPSSTWAFCFKQQTVASNVIAWNKVNREKGSESSMLLLTNCWCPLILQHCVPFFHFLVVILFCFLFFLISVLLFHALSVTYTSVNQSAQSERNRYLVAPSKLGSCFFKLRLWTVLADGFWVSFAQNPKEAKNEEAIAFPSLVPWCEFEATSAQSHGKLKMPIMSTLLFHFGRKCYHSLSCYRRRIC